jgi:hypothetical protein
MTNFVIKNDLFFTLEKSEGNTDFPRKFYARKVSGNQIKIRTLGSNEALLVDVWSLENFTINGVAYTDVHLAITALQPILWNESSGNANTPVDVLPILTEIRDELINDDCYQLFEDTDGNVLFGKIGNDGMMNYYKSDGTLYTGVVKPYSRDIIVSTTDYCANSVPYTLIQFRDADTKQVVETIWRNDNTLTESTTAPASSTKGACLVENITVDTFQVVDCQGNNIGSPQKINKTTVLNKVTSIVCNTSDITGPIITAIQEQTQSLQVARLHDILQTPPMAIGATVTIGANKFATISVLAVKGEFRIVNTANDFSSDVVLSVGTIQSNIEISEDGIGTASGATNLSQGFETRSNAYDISKSGNSYTITAVRANSILQLDLYK